MIGPVKAKFKVADTGASAEVMGAEYPCIFNPTEFTIQRNVNYAQHKIPGLDRPVLQYVSGEADTLSFSLTFDTYSAGENSNNLKVLGSTVLADVLKIDVREFTDPIMKLTLVDSDVHAPDLVQFVWGKMNYKGYITSLSQRFTMFSFVGKPVRSVLDVSMIITEGKFDKKERNSPDRTKARLVAEGDALFMFAFAEYGACSEWRRIADANEIDNPRKLKSGSDISIPPIL